MDEFNSILEIANKLPDNLDDITIKQIKEISKLENALNSEVNKKRKEINVQINKLQILLNEQIRKLKIIDKIYDEFRFKIKEVKTVFEEEKPELHISNFPAQEKSKDNYANVCGVRFISPIIKNYKDSMRHPLVPCTFLYGKEKIFIIYFPSLGQINCVREPQSLFVKKGDNKYTIAHNAIDNDKYIVEGNHTFAFSPFKAAHWKLLEKNMGMFNNFTVQNVEGGVRQYGQAFVFNDCRTILKATQTASDADMSFCFDLHAQLYFMMYLAARTSLKTYFPAMPI